MASHKKKAQFLDLLEEGYGDDRLLRELGSRLRAKVTKHWQGYSLGEFEDNATRMRATELLADIRGRRKTQLDVDLHSHDDGVRIYLPDNGRGDTLGPGDQHD